MSKSFRPVEEIWGDSSSSFLQPEDLEDVLITIAEHSFAGDVEAADYLDVRSIWIENAVNFFDYVKDKSTDFIIANLLDHVSVINDDDVDDLKSVIENIKALDAEWRKSIQEDGSINFYIDQF